MRERTRTPWLLVALVAAALLTAPAAANAQAGSPSVCPATFEVLHDDTVGALYLPKGHYRVTILRGPARSPARETTDLLRQFLEDFDGRLPRPWVVNAQAARSRAAPTAPWASASRRPTSGGGGGGGGHYPSGSVCPGTFRVRHDDRIGTFVVPAGALPDHAALGVGRINCADAATYLGALPPGLRRHPAAPVAARPGDRIVHARSPQRRLPHQAGWSARRGRAAAAAATHPAGNRCPGTFRVLHNDSIGKLRLRNGRYRDHAGRAAGSPARAPSALFRSFLNDFEGTLPRPWVLERPDRHIHARSGAKTGFRVKPARLARLQPPDPPGILPAWPDPHTDDISTQRFARSASASQRLREVTFPLVMRGYHRNSVDDFLAELIEPGRRPRGEPDPRGSRPEGARRARRGDRGHPPARTRDGRRDHGALAFPGRRRACSAPSARRRSCGATPTSTPSR